jgi:hypothetical protein
MLYLKTKNPNCGKFWRVLKCWYILWPFGIFYGHLIYFMAIWYILRPFGIFCWFYRHLEYFFSVLGCCAKRNLATLSSGTRNCVQVKSVTCPEPRDATWTRFINFQKVLLTVEKTPFYCCPISLLVDKLIFQTGHDRPNKVQIIWKNS